MISIQPHKPGTPPYENRRCSIDANGQTYNRPPRRPLLSGTITTADNGGYGAPPYENHRCSIDADVQA